MKTDVKNAIVYGLVIGILSCIWLYMMQKAGYNNVKDNNLSPYEYLSVLIPLIGLYFGVRAYRSALDGQIGFLQALVQCFKILIVGGVIAVFTGILYLSYVAKVDISSDLSGRIFGALLVGILLSLGVSLLLMTKTRKID